MEPAAKPAITEAARRAVDLRFVELIDKVRRNRPGDDLELLRRAYDFAAEQHKTQTRLSGEPFLSHPVEVAHILADMKLDVTSICAALLHDVVEDTKIPLETITEHFGADVARLVEGTTKISRLDLLAPEARQAENVRKMLLAMVNDVRVVVVKLADRLHNMRTLNYLDPAKQQRIARETLDIYAPVANRLGMGLIRGELEDLSFRYLEPESFFDVQKKLATKQKVFDKFLLEVQDSIRDKMVETGIPAEVQARVKRAYSLHLKIQKQQRVMDRVYDLLAIRPYGQQVVDLIHHPLLFLNLQMQRVGPLDPRLNFRGNAGLHHFVADGVLHFQQEFVEDFLFGGQLFLHVEKRFRFEITERKIFQLAANQTHSQTVGDWRIYVQRFPGGG